MVTFGVGPSCSARSIVGKLTVMELLHREWSGRLTLIN